MSQRRSRYGSSEALPHSISLRDRQALEAATDRLQA